MMGAVYVSQIERYIRIAFERKFYYNMYEKPVDLHAEGGNTRSLREPRE